jgi:hypothetical protein
VSAPEVRAPGQAEAGPGADLPPAAGQRARGVLAGLFPVPPGPASRAGLARWAFLLLVQVAAVVVGANSAVPVSCWFAEMPITRKLAGPAAVWTLMVSPSRVPVAWARSQG